MFVLMFQLFLRLTHNGLIRSEFDSAPEFSTGRTDRPNVYL